MGIITAIVSILKAVPALRDILSLFSKEWHEFDRRRNEQIAQTRFDEKEAAVAAAVAAVRPNNDKLRAPSVQQQQQTNPTPGL